jgi:RNA polymerase sigma-70 factor (ECF subfamily)
MANDRDALRDGLVQLLPRLRRFGRALTGNSFDGDDLVHSAIERALTKAEQWDSSTRLDSWMYRIMQNLWIDQVRARKVRGTIVDLENIDSEASAPVQSPDDGIMLARMRECMSRLPEEQRIVMALVVVDGLAYKEAASVLDIPIGTIMSRLARARTALVTMLADFEASADAHSGKSAVRS